MASKRTKNHKEIHEEAISNEEFLDILKRLVKIESEMKKSAKEVESQKQKDREEKAKHSLCVGERDVGLFIQ